MKNSLKAALMLVGTLAIGIAGCANTGETTAIPTSDSWITTKVQSEIGASKQIGARNISVSTTAGVVTLRGTAATTREANRAAEIAHGVAGVKFVENDIRVE